MYHNVTWNAEFGHPREWKSKIYYGTYFLLHRSGYAHGEVYSRGFRINLFRVYHCILDTVWHSNGGFLVRDSRIVRYCRWTHSVRKVHVVNFTFSLTFQWNQISSCSICNDFELLSYLIVSAPSMSHLAITACLTNIYRRGIRSLRWYHFLWGSYITIIINVIYFSWNQRWIYK